MAIVPKNERPKGIVFVSEGAGCNTGTTFRCIAYRNPRNGEMYCFSPTTVVTAYCQNYKHPAVIVERVK